MPSKQRKRATSRKEKPGPLIGCGVDVVELARFKQVLERGGVAFRRRIFTEREEAYARRRKHTRVKHLAARFAAKEAVIKALSQIDPTRMHAMNQIEVCNDRFGRPSILLHGSGRNTVRIHISLSHVESVAVASVIAIQ